MFVITDLQTAFHINIKQEKYNVSPSHSLCGNKINIYEQQS